VSLSKKVAITAVALAATFQQVAAQSTAAKSAGQLVDEYGAAGDNADTGLIQSLFYRGCPKQDARRDSIFQGILELKPTARRVSDIALYWTGALSRCNEPRLDRWFRDQMKTARDPLTMNQLARALVKGHPLPENVSEVKHVALDSSIQDEIRTNLLVLLVERLNTPDRIELLAEVFEKSGRIPEPYHSSEVYAIKRTADVSVWRTRLTDALVRNPRHSGAIELLQYLGSDAIYETGSKDSDWLRRFSRSLETLERDPRASAELKAGALKTRSLIRSK
jgi:hypothetical protein